MSEHRELLIGCGYQRKKLVHRGIKEWINLTTLDLNEDCKPDIRCDLNRIGKFTCISSSIHGSKAVDAYGVLRENYFSEVHAYEVLEHLGWQGDITSFFAIFDNVYRVLSAGGVLCATTPSRFSGWLWGDPGHTRAILPESLSFLDRSNYQSLGANAMSDYRQYFKSDWRVLETSDDKVFHRFILQTIKPARK